MLQRMYIPSRPAGRRLLSAVLQRPSRCPPHQKLQIRRYNVPPRSQPQLSHQYQPLKAAIRWRDFTLGTVFGIVAIFALADYAVHRYHKTLEKALQHSAELEPDEESAALNEEFAQKFAEARKADDQESLKELTFEFQRRSATREKILSDPNIRIEWTPLPNFPEGHERYGKEHIPQDDTLMFVGKSPDGKVQYVTIAINADFEELNETLSTLPTSASNQDLVNYDNKLAEILGRFDCQAVSWQQEDKLQEGPLQLAFCPRESLLMFLFIRPGEYAGPLFTGTLESKVTGGSKLRLHHLRNS